MSKLTTEYFYDKDGHPDTISLRGNERGEWSKPIAFTIATKQLEGQR